MLSIKVVAGIVFREDGKFLIARKAANSSNPGKWEFPGGKIELDETPEKALARELKEELNMAILAIEYFYTCETINETQDLTIQLSAFICQYEPSEIQLSDHDEIRWIDATDIPSKELFVKADLPILEKLVEEWF